MNPVEPESGSSGNNDDFVWSRLIALKPSFKNFGTNIFMHTFNKFFSKVLNFTHSISDIQFFNWHMYMISDLVTGSCTIGRGPECDYQIEKLNNLVQLSRTHFRITKNMMDINSPVYIQVSCAFWFHLFGKWDNKENVKILINAFVGDVSFFLRDWVFFFTRYIIFNVIILFLFNL